MTKTFDIMTNFLTSWRFFWHHEVFMTLWRLCDVTNYWRHDVCCTYWRHNDNFDTKNVLTTWRILLTSWHLLNSWLTLSLHFCRSDCIFSLFREQNLIKTCFWCYNELFWCHGMFLMSWRQRVSLTLWQIFWHHDELFELLTYFWRYDVLLMSSHVFDVMTNFLTTWRKFWRYELLMLWCTCWGYDVITISWQHRHNAQPNTYKYIRMMMGSDFAG